MESSAPSLVRAAGAGVSSVTQPTVAWTAPAMGVTGAWITQAPGRSFLTRAAVRSFLTLAAGR